MTLLPVQLEAGQRAFTLRCISEGCPSISILPPNDSADLNASINLILMLKVHFRDLSMLASGVIFAYRVLRGEDQKILHKITADPFTIYDRLSLLL